MPLINCEISATITWSKNCVIFFANAATEFSTTDTKLYVHIATLSTEDNIELLKQLESDFKRTIDRNKYQSKVTKQAKIDI